MRTELKPCRHCGHTARFAVQLQLDGDRAELVTEVKCTAIERIAGDLSCEAITIDIASRSRSSRHWR